jgi:HNH endonuclease
MDTTERRRKSFWANVNKDGPIPAHRPDLGPCWLWTLFIGSGGYGKVKVGSIRDGSRRFAYLLEKGPIPTGLTIDHLCFNPPCCNPAHLEAVTQRVNTLRNSGPVAAEAARTHCPRGHAYDFFNTYLSPSGHRECRECRREHDKKRHDASYWREWRARKAVANGTA